MPRNQYARWTCRKCHRQAIAILDPNETVKSLTKRFEQAHAAEGCGGFHPTGPQSKPPKRSLTGWFRISERGS